MALREIVLGLRECQGVQQLLVWLAEIQRHLVDRCCDQEEVCTQVPREGRCGEVLVDHRFDTHELAVLLHDGYPAATGCDHREPGLDKRHDRVELNDLQREGRRHDSPPSTPRVLHNAPPIVLLVRKCRGLIHE